MPLRQEDADVVMETDGAIVTVDVCALDTSADVVNDAVAFTVSVPERDTGDAVWDTVDAIVKVKESDDDPDGLH